MSKLRKMLRTLGVLNFISPFFYIIFTFVHHLHITMLKLILILFFKIFPNCQNLSEFKIIIYIIQFCEQRYTIFACIGYFFYADKMPFWRTKMGVFTLKDIVFAYKLFFISYQDRYSCRMALHFCRQSCNFFVA